MSKAAVSFLIVAALAGILGFAQTGEASSASAGEWGPVVDWPIIPLHIALTPDGEVMSFGSRQDARQGGDKVFDVWKPEMGTGPNSHSIFPNGTRTDLFCAVQVVDPIRDVILTAGGDNGNPDDNGVNKETTIYSKSRGLIAQPDMNIPRWYPTGTTLPNGDILIEGGAGEGGPYGEAVLVPELFNIEKGWNLLTGINSSYAYGNDQNRWWYPRSWVAPDGRIFGISGSNMYYVDPQGTGSLSEAGNFPGTNIGPTSTAVMYRPGKILQVGGGAYSNHDYERAASNAATIVDINSGAPVVTQAEPMAKPRHWSTSTVLPDGTVLVTGGSQIQNTLWEVAHEAELWDPDTGIWTTLAPESRARLYHSTALLLPDATVLVAGGGTPGPQTNLNGQIFSPPYLFNGNELAERPTVSAPQEIVYGESFPITVSPDVSRVSLVRAGATTHSVNSGQRWMELGLAGSGEQRTVTAPANGNLAPPGTYLLFAMNDQGTPSVAAFVDIDPS